ncbi:ABC transporter substrate-binding protein [Deinococcus maricopensis]|uniref:ABC-type transporter, periplasmic subunit n=1 Tax=Deinococcus maricopensis (strain DSM 21211 / LMG 22137 / NRRL B-23946 / LB-34) TaxID=709986 RepID=E8U4B1_DEIML|nr:ABC transporter substrate-binding protein [Deinococcus maricopensis]ADV65948.1 ABC-type transporter, periplasmic subunit [Deinococcus maricopensis DSM 21211]
MKHLLTLALALTLPAASAVSIKHERGTLTLPAPAKRVIALEYSFLDTLIALGVQPVGGALGLQGGDRGAPTYLKALTRAVPAVGSRAQPNLEAMLALKPDLILSDAFVHTSLYPNLARLAPTAAFQSRRGSYEYLQQQVLDIGALVGRSDVARRLVDDQARLVQKARAFANKKAPPVVMAVATEQTLTLHSSESFVGSLIEKLGRKNAVKPQGTTTQYEVGLEALVALNPATLVVFTGADEKPIVREWAKNPLWNKISAVQRGRVFEFDRDLWTRARGPIALKTMLAQTIDSGLLADKAPSAAFAFKKN